MCALKLLNDLAMLEEGNTWQNGLGFETYAMVLRDASDSK